MKPLGRGFCLKVTFWFNLAWQRGPLGQRLTSCGQIGNSPWTNGVRMWQTPSHAIVTQAEKHSLCGRCDKITRKIYRTHASLSAQTKVAINWEKMAMVDRWVCEVKGQIYTTNLVVYFYLRRESDMHCVSKKQILRYHMWPVLYTWATMLWHLLPYTAVKKHFILAWVSQNF